MEHIGEVEQTMREVMQLAGQQSLAIERNGSARFREMGLMIGSGVVASGCKQIVTQRLKLPGAQWLLEGAVYTAKAVRPGSVVNGRFSAKGVLPCPLLPDYNF